MENPWILYSLAWLIAVGLADFVKKIIISKWINKEVFLLLCFWLYVVFFWLNYYFQGTNEDLFTTQILTSAAIIGVNSFIWPLCILVSLKYLDTSLTLICVRLLSSFIILFIGYYLLWDKISFYNLVWFLIGMLAIWLLSGFKLNKKYLELNKKGVCALLIATISVITIHTYFKYIMPSINPHDFMPMQFTIAFISLLVYMLLRWKLKDITLPELKISFWYAIFMACIVWIHFLYFLPNIYLLGPLSLGYKMLSYSLIVPIILSVIFLWDPINKKRILAFVLTIISIFLFLI